jgi:hypothetical protein
MVTQLVQARIQPMSIGCHPLPKDLAPDITKQLLTNQAYFYQVI